MSMKARIIHTKIWDDNWFLSLSRSSRILFLYLLSNQSIGLSDIYELPDAKIIYQTGLNSSELEAAKKDLEGKAGFYKGWVKIYNCDRYQQFSGPKNEIAKEKELERIPPDVRDTLSIPYRYPIDSTSNQYPIISNKYPVINNKKLEEKDFQEIAEQYSVPLSFVLSKWDDLQNWCKSKGKTYKDYKAALKNWVKKDAIKIKKEQHDKSKIVYIDPE